MTQTLRSARARVLHGRRVLLLLLVAGGLAARPLSAGETQWWVTDQASEYAKAESHGVVVHADGSLGLGPRAERFPAESLSVVWALAVLRDGSVAVGGDHGRILRWTASGGVRPWVRLPVGQVLSLAAEGEGVVAGTGPEGAVYRVGARGDTTLLARTGERYVWGLAPAGTGWYAATGTRGRLLRIEGGRSRIVLDTDESNLVSIAGDGHGGVFAGGDSKGRVIHALADGTVRTVFDASEDEIRGLTRGPDGALYAAALSASAVSDDDERGAEGPGPVKSAVSGGRAVIYRIQPDSSTAQWWTSPQPFVFALASTPEGVVAATGNRGAIYRLERANAGSQVLAVSQGQVTAMVTGGDGTLWAATSNGATLWRIGPRTAERGELLSPVFDGRRLARFGRAVVRGERSGSTLELETRSGNTDPPDTTWTPWSGGAIPAEGARVLSPPARYLQWKLGLRGGSARIEAVEVSWREPNLAPRVEEVVVAPQGQGFQSGEIQPRVEPLTQTLTGGQKVEYTLPPAQSARQLRDLPMFARGLRTITWRATDPNGDNLRYRVDVQREGSGEWVKLGSELDATAFTWDTNALPDGRYRVRVTATDAPANPLGEERTDEALSPPFTVDNTPPAVSAFSARVAGTSIEVEGRAEDAQGPLTRIEVSVDDADWRSLTPDDGFADRPGLAFHGRWPEAGPGDHLVAVRAVDAAGNTAIRSAVVKVLPGR